MIEQRKYFTQHNGNVPPVARSDAEWHGTDMELSLEAYKKKVRACEKIAGVRRLESKVSSWAM